jgi:integrase
VVLAPPLKNEVAKTPPNCAASAVPLNLVQRWLGHASLTTTAIYLDALGDEEREIAARMWTATT